jgi:hypothetical protein
MCGGWALLCQLWFPQAGGMWLLRTAVAVDSDAWTEPVTLQRNLFLQEMAACITAHNTSNLTPCLCSHRLLLFVLCIWPSTACMLLAGFAVVKLGTDKKTGEQFAVKIMTLPPAGVEPGDNENTR